MPPTVPSTHYLLPTSQRLCPYFLYRDWRLLLKISAPEGPQIYLRLRDRDVCPLCRLFLIFDLSSFKRHMSSLLRPANQPRPRSDTSTNQCSSGLSEICAVPVILRNVGAFFKGNGKRKTVRLRGTWFRVPHLTQP